MDIFYQLGNFFKTMFHWWVVITPWEQGLRIRLGKHVKTLDKGIHFKVPVIDKIYVQPTRLRVICIADQSLMTADKKVVILSGSLAYKVKDLEKLYETLHNPTAAIEQQVMGIISECVFETKLDDLSPKHLMELVNKEINLEKYGLESSDYFLTSFASVRTYRIIGGELGRWSDYEGEIKTTTADY